MKEYNIKIDLAKGTIIFPDIFLVKNDYNSIKFNFEFENDKYIKYTKIFQLQYPDKTMWKKEIKNNSITLVDYNENEEPISILTQNNKYYFDIAVYNNDSKLTTTQRAYFNVRLDFGNDNIELDDRLPVLDDLIKDVNENIEKTNNLDIDIDNSLVTITKKDGSKKSENIKGEKGDKGDPGEIKMIIVNLLPEIGNEDTIYLVPNTDSGEENNYDEYIWANNSWEKLGGASVQVDLTNYVQFTDVASKTHLGVAKMWTSTNEEGEIGLNISTEV